MAISAGEGEVSMGRNPEGTPQRKTILITQEVDISRCYGDLTSSVLLNIAALKPELFNGPEIPDEVRQAFEKGHQVFLTENHGFMFVKPE